MSKITVTTIAGQTSGSDANKVKIESGDTLQVESNATVGGTLGVTGATTLSSNVAVNGGTGGQVATNFSSASTMGMKINDTNSGNLGGMLGFYSGSGAGTLRANIQNANNAGIHVNVGNGSVVFTQTGYTAANALDDYEEGQWTPDVRNNTSTSNWSTKKGDYVKIGRVVYCWFVVDHGNSNSGSGTAQLELTGLPFAVQLEAASGSTFAHNNTQSFGMWSSNPSNQVGNLMTAGSNTANLYKGGGGTASQMTFVTGSFCYIATT